MIIIEQDIAIKVTIIGASIYPYLLRQFARCILNCMDKSTQLGNIT